MYFFIFLLIYIYIYIYVHVSIFIYVLYIIIYLFLNSFYGEHLRNSHIHARELSHHMFAADYKLS